MTSKEACEYIAAAHADSLEKRGAPLHSWLPARALDPEKDIWEISKTGELWPVFDLYALARIYRGEAMTLDEQLSGALPAEQPGQ